MTVTWTTMSLLVSKRFSTLNILKQYGKITEIVARFLKFMWIFSNKSLSQDLGDIAKLYKCNTIFFLLCDMFWGLRQTINKVAFTLENLIIRLFISLIDNSARDEIRNFLIFLIGALKSLKN